MMNGKKKLLIVGPTKGSVHVRNFYFLVKNCFDQVLIVCNEKVDFCDCRVLDFSVKNPFRVFSHIKRLRQVIDEYQPDIIHIHQVSTLAYIATRANKRKIPSVLTCWGSDILVVPGRSRLMREIVKYCLLRASVLTADAYYVRDEIELISGRKDTCVVNFGIDPPIEKIPPKSRIIYSNRVHKPLYRVDWIVQAFATFVQKHPGWKLVIGAHGDLTQALEQQAARTLPEGSFEFIGFVDAQTNLRNYSQASIWVSVPESDGTSVSLLEAMACGCIPVVSNLPANKEWITDGENGIIVQDNLLTALERALTLSQSDVFEKNSKIILARGTKEVNAGIFNAIYGRLLN